MATNANILRDRHGNLRVDINVNRGVFAELESLLQGLPGKMRIAERDAINKALISGRQVIVAGLSKRFTLSQRDVRNRVRVNKARTGRLKGYLNVKYLQFALRRFKHREDRRKRGWGTASSGTGVYVTIDRGGAETNFPHAFLATTKVRGKNVFQRTGSSRNNRRNITTLPAFDVYPLFWADRALGPAAIDRMQDQFERSLINRAAHLAGSGQ